METKDVWKATGSGNVVMQRDGWFVSYNPNTAAGHMAGLLTDLGNLLGGNLSDGEETALKNENGDWKVLTGDFRKEYEDCRDYAAAVEVYEKYRGEHRNNYSTD